MLYFIKHLCSSFPEGFSSSSWMNSQLVLFYCFGKKRFNKINYILFEQQRCVEPVFTVCNQHSRFNSHEQKREIFYVCRKCHYLKIFCVLTARSISLHSNLKLRSCSSHRLNFCFVKFHISLMALKAVILHFSIIFSLTPSLHTDLPLTCSL